jgi:hypothetical protein
MRRNKRGGTLTYSGPAYVRPVQRGICLGNIDFPGNPPYLDDLVERLIGGYGDCDIELMIRAVRRDAR